MALVADVPLSLAVGWRPGAAHLVAVGSAWMYDLRLKETVLSWLPYAVSFGLVPVIIATALPGHPRPKLLVVAAAACLGVAAHFANTVGDADEDAATGVRGLPQRIGPQQSITAAVVLVAVAAGLLVAATSGATATLAAAGVGVAAIPLTTWRTRSRHAAFAAVIVAAGALVVAFVAAGGSHLTAQ